MAISNLTSALRIGISGMQVSQSALSTVSHNVVNASTVGYSRQVMQAGATSANGYGNGVQISSIQRVSDKFLVGRALTTTSDATYASTKSTYMQSLEDSFSSANASGGLESVVGSFINSLNSLANDASNSSLRRAAVQAANVTASAIKSTNQDLVIAARDADAAITADLNTVNQLLKDIYTLNIQITAQQASGNGSNNNDLLDARSTKISQLSESFGLQVNESSAGSIRIATENGRKLVDENGYVQLSRGSNIGDYQSIVAQNVLQDGSLSITELPINTNELATGRVKALAEMRDTVIPNLLAQLDEFTETFGSAVNKLASQGTSSPPIGSLTSGNTVQLSTTGTDLLATPGFSAINGTTINISVTNSLGNVVTTTVGTPITLAPTLPATTLSLVDIAAIINNDPTIGNTALGGTNGVIATAGTDVNGKPILTIRAANTNNKLVLDNVTGDALGILGMNNLFTGTDSSDISVRSDILANADLLPVAGMRADGGVSNTDNQNILGLASLADTKLSFASAGGLGMQTATLVTYLNTVTSNLAVAVSSSKDNQTFTTNLQSQAQEAATSVSGVNINEELAQMLVYQNSFQASSRIISVVNDLLQELVNIVN